MPSLKFWSLDGKLLIDTANMAAISCTRCPCLGHNGTGTGTIGTGTSITPYVPCRICNNCYHPCEYCLEILNWPITGCTHAQPWQLSNAGVYGWMYNCTGVSPWEIAMGATGFGTLFGFFYDCEANTFNVLHWWYYDYGNGRAGSSLDWSADIGNGVVDCTGGYFRSVTFGPGNWQGWRAAYCNAAPYYGPCECTSGGAFCIKDFWGQAPVVIITPGPCSNLHYGTGTGTDVPGTGTGTDVLPSGPGWYCVSGVCELHSDRPVGALTGPFETQADCEAIGNCSTEPTHPGWYCIGDADGLGNQGCVYYIDTPVDPPGGIIGGPYDSSVTCNTVCGIPIHTGTAALTGVASPSMMRGAQPFRSNPAQISHGRFSLDCVMRGDPTGETIDCKTCGGRKQVPIFHCPIYGKCSVDFTGAKEIHWCRTCTEKCHMRWAYGVTTVPMRRETTLPKTLASLARSGFDHPRLFVDGCPDPQSWEQQFKLSVTGRDPAVKTFGNWVLSLWELYLREPAADRYAIFQDDIEVSRNLRPYLERCKFPDKGYWNLHSSPQNEALAKGKTGWYPSNQRGRGALALVFDRKGVQTLLSNPEFVGRPTDAVRGTRNVDGAVIWAFNHAKETEGGWLEYVHAPSLVQHIGNDLSSMGNKPQPLSESYRGAEFDLMSLL